MRGFWLKDDAGTTVSLTGDGVYFDAPSGLGATFHDGVNHLGNGIFADAGSTDEQPDEVTGDLVFTPGGLFDHAYAQYRHFIDWALAAAELTLVYAPGGELASGHQRRVEIVTLGKSEVNAGALRCPVTLRCMEPWVNPSATAQAMTASGATLTLSPIVTGHRPAAFRLEVVGGLQYPTITVTQNGEELGRCQIYSTFSTSEGLLLDTRPNAQGVWRVNNDEGTKVDMMQYVYLDYDPFPLIPVGTGAQIKVTNESTQIGSGSVKLYEYYRSV